MTGKFDRELLLQLYRKGKFVQPTQEVNAKFVIDKNLIFWASARKLRIDDK